MTDKTRLRKNNEKKVYSVSAAMILAADVADTALVELFKLPANCLIVDAAIVTEIAGQTNLTVDFGFDGGNELGNDIDVDETGVDTVPLTVSGGGTIGTKAPRLLTGSGKTVTAKFSADPTAGKFHFIVEYIEYTLGNGQLTNYTA